MAQAALWKGAIHFGHSNIPVRLQTAVKEERIQFHLLHKRDHTRLRQQMICALEEKPVPPEEQVKGFEVEDNRYLIIDPEEIERTAPESDRTIAVHEFVRREQIDAVWYDRAYCLEPDAEPQGYAALAAALLEMGVGGICTWTMRKRSYLGALLAAGTTLRLHTLRHADELLAAPSLDLPGDSLSGKELEIAGELIAHLSASFEPAKFQDEHQAKLRRLIEKKARGEKIALALPRRVKPTAPGQLLKALEASLKRVA